MANKKQSAGAYYWEYNPKGKKTIVAVHGLRGTHHGLQFIAAELSGYRLIIPDLPGFGESKPLKTKHNTTSYMAWLEKFISDLKLTEKPILLGHSFGTIVASKYAASHPKDIEKLILINPISKHGGKIGQLLAKGYYGAGQRLPEPFGSMLLRSKLVTRAMSRTMTTTKDPMLKDRVYQQHFSYFATFANKQSVSETFSSTISSSVITSAPQLTMPVLLIAGESDTFVPLSGQKELHSQLADSQLHVIPGVGHLVHYETPSEAAKAIRQFLL